MKKNISICLSSIMVVLLMASCQKINKPAMGDYPSDDSKPPLKTGDLRFYVPFGDNDQVRYQAEDSISGDPAWVYPLSLVDGISGKGVQATDGKAIKYMSSNDLNAATDVSVAFWMKNTANSRTEFVFSLVDDTYGWGHSAMFLMMEHGDATATTLKFGLMDQWMEFPDGHKFQKPLLDGNWHHLAFVYDKTTSKMSFYFDGAVITDAPASATDVKKDGNPRGALDFSHVTNIVLGGWNKNANLAGPTDDWVKSYTGALDQFRIYNKSLTAAEVLALYTTKQ